MADLAKYREKFLIPQIGTVEIRIAVPENVNSRVSFYTLAGFDCSTCCKSMVWNKERRIMECEECGYEMTASEGIILCDAYIHNIEKLSKLLGKKRGWLWRFLRWLGVKK